MSQIRRGIPARSLPRCCQRVRARRYAAVSLVLIGLGSSFLFASPQWHRRAPLPLVEVATLDAPRPPDSEALVDGASSPRFAPVLDEFASITAPIQDGVALATGAASAALEGERSKAKGTKHEVRWFNGRPIRPARKMTMTVTAYSPDERSCGASADGITASGYSVWANAGKMVAADTSLLPFGSLVSVDGYDGGSPVPVLDRGGKIKGHRLDLLYPTHEVARRWGVRKMQVTVWEYADGKGKEAPARFRRR